MACSHNGGCRYLSRSGFICFIPPGISVYAHRRSAPAKKPVGKPRTKQPKKVKFISRVQWHAVGRVTMLTIEMY
ncbi:unnamed protein product [Plutella xylostella]|uniref:(diamondback moth) hypothetical protein n=1 Tax=Plutella xylostella TaxID=51655 RepID=A0A8S4F4X6_PLUXY|nr:unnamed protein product [Plutella xylostella]